MHLGVGEDNLNKIVSAFPDIDDGDDSDETLAITNSLNEVCHGIWFSDEEWKQWLNVCKSEIEEVYRKWAELRGWKQKGIR